VRLTRTGGRGNRVLAPPEQGVGDPGGGRGLEQLLEAPRLDPIFGETSKQTEAFWLPSRSIQRCDE
jgi:hypothetical protein